MAYLIIRTYPYFIKATQRYNFDAKIVRRKLFAFSGFSGTQICIGPIELVDPYKGHDPLEFKKS